MNSRLTTAGVAVVAALLATAGAAAAFGASGGPAQAQQSPAQQELSDTITVGASGTVQAEADRAVVRVGVVATGDDIESVRSDLSTNASSMRSALTDMGINSSQIRTAYYDISTNRRGGGERGEPKYRAIHSFVVTVENSDDVGQVVDTAVTNGANEVDGIQFTLSADKRQQLRQQALEKAMDTARGEASTIASAEDLTITGVGRVTTTQYDTEPRAVERAALASGDAGGSTSINSGPVTVRASVTVVYETGSS